MKVMQSYRAEIQGANFQFNATIRIYRKALNYFIRVANEQWCTLSALEGKQRVNLMDKLVHQTSGNPNPPYDFDRYFYKFPAYFRRSAINDALGIVSAFQSNLANFKRERYLAISQGKPFKKNAPRLVLKHFKHPVLYKGNMFRKNEQRNMLVKTYQNHDWVWTSIVLKQTDYQYLVAQTGIEKSPSLVKRGRKYYLQFPFERNVQFNEKPLMQQTILAIDFGVNHAAVCSVMQANGTVLGRYFIDQPREKDQMQTLLKRMRCKQQQSGKKAKMPKIWAKINGYNTQIVNASVAQITAIMQRHQVDCVVMEYLAFNGVKRSRKVHHKLIMWRYRMMQTKVIAKAQLLGCRYAFINAANTSKLAFDGSGAVKRNKKNVSCCTFSTGKQYHCDLNATYNIGARYFIKAIQKATAVKMWSQVVAKVPELERRTQCTLSTYVALCEVLTAASCC